MFRHMPVVPDEPGRVQSPRIRKLFLKIVPQFVSPRAEFRNLKKALHAGTLSFSTLDVKMVAPAQENVQTKHMKERVIFGATSTIGAAVARYWAAKKDRITIVGRSGDKLAAMAKDLQNRGAESVELTIMDFNNPERLWADVLELFRDKKSVDTLLICQGVSYPGLEMNPEIKKIHNLWQVNFQSVVTILMASKAHFVHNAKGTVAVLSSHIERGRAGSYVYGSSKIALTQFMAGYRDEVSKFGVRAVTILPGLVESNVTKDWDRSGKNWVKPDLAAMEIVNRIDSETTLYTPKYWGFINYFLKILPEFLFYRFKI